MFALTTNRKSACGFILLGFVITIFLGATILSVFTLSSGPTSYLSPPRPADLRSPDSFEPQEPPLKETMGLTMDGPEGMLPGSHKLVSFSNSNRKIIKTAEMTLQVKDTDTAINQVAGIVTDYDGYIIKSRAWNEGGYRLATVTLSVPVDNFEQVVQRLRGMAEEVLSESASGEDVTEQYVDLESRLRNLEITQARIKTFMDQAVTVEEALEVNRQLSEIEGQIENVKGKMNYIKERAAYSTITVNLQTERLMPTPTPTPTLTPMPTLTPTPSLPDWKPAQTFNSAAYSLILILRFLINVFIWLAVILLPLGIPVAVVIWLIIRWIRKRSQRRNQEE